MQTPQLRLCACVLLGVTLASCSKKEKETEPVVPVRVSPAIRGSIRNVITADAILYPRDQANITPKITAPVRRFLVNRGDKVKEGQLLGELENRDLVASAVASKGQFGQAESNYRSIEAANVPEQVTKAQTDVDSARETLDAAKKLFDNREQLFKEGALARKLVDDAQVAQAQARAQFETAQKHLQAFQSVSKDEQIKTAAAQVEAAKGQYDSAQAQVLYSEIRSPINGVVTDRPLYPGEIANPGTPLMTIMDTSAVVARINMSQNQAAAIKVGSPATISQGEGDPINGKVIIVSPAVDANSTTVQVWVQVDNPGGMLRVGTSVHVAIVAATLDALLIHAAAVLPSAEGGTIAMVIDDKDVAHEKKIETGVKEGDLVQVLSGLQSGDRVVVAGGLGLEDKAKVHVLKAGETIAVLLLVAACGAASAPTAPPTVPLPTFVQGTPTVAPAPTATPTPTTMASASPSQIPAGSPTPTAAASPSSSAATGVSGKWTGMWQDSNQAQINGHFQVEFAQDGSSFTGQISISNSCVPQGTVSGTIDSNNNINFGAVKGSYTISFTGQWNGDSMSGSYTAPGAKCGNGSGTWSATRS